MRSGGGSSSEALAEDASVSVVKQGTSGTCTWTIDSAGCLTISPTDGVSGELGDWEDTPPWISYEVYYMVKSVKVTDTVKAKTLSNAFAYMFDLENVDLANLDTSDVTDTSGMFSNCRALKTLALPKLDTSKVKNMQGMFFYCPALETLDLSKLDISSVLNMQDMFNQCSELKTIRFPETLDTSKVENMQNMFYKCSALETLDLTKFDTSSVSYMQNMFDGCSSLRKVTLGENFSFKNGSYLPTPSGEGLTGKWVSSADGKAYAPSMIEGGIAATYTAQMEMGEGMFTVTIPDAAHYTGKPVTAIVESDSLTEGTDYKVAYSDNVSAGTAELFIVGTGNYAGTLRYEFEIAKATPVAPTGLIATYGQTLANVKLPEGWSWQDDSTTSVGTAGEREFKATYMPADTTNYETVRDVPVKVTVAAKAIDATMFSVDTDDATYTGEAITRRVTSEALAEGTDYDVTYSDNVNAGTAKVTITGKGNYSGTLSYSFKIAAAPEPTPAPDPTPTPDPEPTPTPTPEPDPEPTPDPTPTPDPEPEPDPAPAPEVVFPDVDASQWYAGGVAFCAEEGLMTGYAEGDDAGLFGVGRSLTRAELASILWRHAEPAAHEAYAGADNATGMADVADDAWYTGAANWAVKAGVINGFDEGDHREFRPNDPVTAEQLAAILANYADPDGAEGADLGLLSGFADSDAISDWARGSVAWAKAKDIVNGYDENGARYLKPCEEIARERVATILMNAFESGVLK